MEDKLVGPFTDQILKKTEIIIQQVTEQSSTSL